MQTLLNEVGITLLPPEKVRIQIRANKIKTNPVYFVFIYDEWNIMLLDTFIAHSKEAITEGLNERYKAGTQQIFVNLMIEHKGILIIENQNL